jgi:hypothetical protein
MGENISKPNYIGLDGKPCTNPVYYCRSHQLYLSEKDVEVKGCLCKPTYDMIYFRRCKWLVNKDTYEIEKQEQNDRIKKIKQSNKNLGHKNFG